MKTFRPYDPDQPFLLPPSLRDWLPEDHLASFISDVVGTLELSAILAEYEQGDGRGQPPYHPRMMVKLLMYGYCTGKVSSRKIEEATYTDVAYRVLAANQHPDHDSIAEFRKRHLQALASLFVQVLQLCQKAGLVKLGHVAVDGTKIKANASKHKAMSYARMGETEKRLEAEIAALLQQAEAADAAEDQQYGPGRRGNELPRELARRESRLQVIRQAREALEREARERAEQEAQKAKTKLAEREQKEKETGQKARGRAPKVPDPEQAKPQAKDQKNFTDPESKIMMDRATKSFEQAYNAQAVVDGEAQIVVAADVTQEANDKQQLGPMLQQVERNTGEKPQRALADAGYFSEEAVTEKQLQDVDLYVSPDRQKHSEKVELADGAPPAEATVTEAMRHKLRTSEGRKTYGHRKEIVEPVFGQIKEARGFRRFSFRGKEKVTYEWRLVCLTHNLLKLFRATRNKGKTGSAGNRRRHPTHVPLTVSTLRSPPTRLQSLSQGLTAFCLSISLLSQALVTLTHQRKPVIPTGS